jgi:hypothetical protein
MIIATSGSGNSINYSRIISSTSSNYVVADDSKTYRDAILPTNKRLRGLYIIDKDNLVALIWDDTSKNTDVAALNLATLSVSYKPSLNIINNMWTGKFVSASVYYTPSYHPFFTVDNTHGPFISLNGSKKQGIVYSSDMS